MSDEKVYVGDVGTRMNFNVIEDGAAVDLTGYTTLEVRFQRPDKTTFTRELEVISPQSGRVRYTTEEGDLDQSGRWKFQLLIDIPEWDGQGTIGSFWVHKALS